MDQSALAVLLVGLRRRPGCSAVDWPGSSFHIASRQCSFLLPAGGTGCLHRDQPDHAEAACSLCTCDNGFESVPIILLQEAQAACAAGQQIVQQLLSAVLRCLCSDLDEVSQAVLPFLNSYATKLRTTVKRNRVLDEVSLVSAWSCCLVCIAVLVQQNRIHDAAGAMSEQACCPSDSGGQPSTGIETQVQRSLVWANALPLLSIWC